MLFPEGLGQLFFPTLDSENTWIKIQMGRISVLGSSYREKKNQGIVLLLMLSRSVVSDFCDPMNHSTPGFPVLHYLPEFAQPHVHESVMPSNHLILCRALLSGLQSFPAPGSSPMSCSQEVPNMSPWEETAKAGEGKMTGERKGLEAST